MDSSVAHELVPVCINSDCYAHDRRTKDKHANKCSKFTPDEMTRCSVYTPSVPCTGKWVESVCSACNMIWDSCAEMVIYCRWLPMWKVEVERCPLE